MPEYLAPGVYVEETSFRSKSIEGVSTTTTGFIGPTRYGPLETTPEIVTSLEEFERIYGDGQPLNFDDGAGGKLKMDNYMWHAARAFFIEGGKRLYVSRVFAFGNDEDASYARTNAGGATLRARYPGSAGKMRVAVTVNAGRNVLGEVQEKGASGDLERRPTIGALRPHDVVWIRDETSPFLSPPGRHGELWIAERNTQGSPPSNDPSRPEYWQFTSSGVTRRFGEGTMPNPVAGEGLSVRVLTLSIVVTTLDGGPLGAWSNLPIDPRHRTLGATDSFVALFGSDPELWRQPFVVDATTLDGIGLLQALFSELGTTIDEATLDRGITQEWELQGGNDGARPGTAEYEGKGGADSDDLKTGLKQFEDLEDISIVAAPGVSWRPTPGPSAWDLEAASVIGLLLAHAAKMRYRIAVLDSPNGATVGDVRKTRSKIDSKYAALYYPWVRVLDPITRKEIALPPSGFVAGIYARNDINRAVYKAPANEVVNLALGFETMLNKAQQEVLNPEGINCFRFFEGRGMLLWGARTVSSDPEWKYVNFRRYFAYLERSIDRGTQWAVFEPNGERLWANVRETISDFLFNEWFNGALLGEKPERAYFVRCDHSTMTRNDLDNGRLVCLIGVAIIRPAEFVIFRIGQKTADARS
jgi:phage tail sheath protein FI